MPLFLAGAFSAAGFLGGGNFGWFGLRLLVLEPLGSVQNCKVKNLGYKASKLNMGKYGRVYNLL